MTFTVTEQNVLEGTCGDFRKCAANRGLQAANPGSQCMVFGNTAEVDGVVYQFDAEGASFVRFFDDFSHYYTPEKTLEFLKRRFTFPLTLNLPGIRE